MKSRVGFWHAIAFIVVLAATAWAQDPSAAPVDPQAAYPQTTDPQLGYPQAGNPQSDAPGRVARLESMTGQVSVQPQGTGDWVQGSLNRPLTNADNVWADKDSRAELDLGDGVMRINSETSLTLSNVDNNVVQVSLHQGALNVHLRHLYQGEVWEIDTPNLAFTVSKTGDYRFDVDPNGDATMVTVRKGEGEASGQGPAVRVHSDEWARFTGGNSLKHEINNAPPPDSFDEWCSAQDKREDNSVSAHYVAPGVVGADDLDEYGTWKDDSGYGEVWTPTDVPPGWAPYSYGQWVWVSPWGWTWVDNAPWGFAPFHYGRWAYIGASWGWIPGPYWAQPWYAPALVGWFGGPGWGFGFGFGWGFGPRFGWCPLGFREPFRPWYGVSRGYFRNVNLSNTRIANFNRVSSNFFSGKGGAQSAHFANLNKPGALNAMSQNGLQHGLSVHGNSVHLTPNDLKGAQSLSRLNVSPTRESMLGAKASPGARPAAGAFSRPTVSRMTPPA
ncbi:MAG: FecR family protein, partial [Terriglobales bacterium]